MRLILKRTALKEKYTIGHLYYVDGEKETYICDTIEDKVRDINKNGKFDNGEKKVYGETAIPYGTYKVTLDVISPKFSKKEWYAKNANGGRVPRLLNVPSFDGILMHIGQTYGQYIGNERFSAGCIILGYNKVKGAVINGDKAFKELYKLLTAHKKEGLSIEII